MSHAFSVQVCRIVVPEKLADRFLISGVLRQKEGSFIGDQVLLAYVLEITKPWFPSSKVFPLVLESLETGLAKLGAGEGLGDQFEVLLKAVNEQLNSISEMGETDWIGNFNGIIMVLSEDQLHFSQTGHCPAYLLQKNRIRQITDETSEHDPHPLKTFSNLASGTLQEHDYILVSNQELYNEISLDALRRIMNNNTPYQACQAIARELKKQKNLAISPLITHVISKGDSENLAISDPTEIILEEELQGPLKKIHRKLQPFLARLQHHGTQAGRAGLKIARQTHETVKTTVLPKATEIFKKGVDGAMAMKENVGNQLAKSQEVAPVVVSPAVEVIAPHTNGQKKPTIPVVEVITPRALEDKKSPPQLVIPVSEFALDSDLPIGLMSTEAKSKGSPQDMLRNLANLARQHWNAFKYKKHLALLVGIILLIGTVALIFRHRQGPASKATVDTNANELKEITDLTKQAMTAVQLKQMVEASKEIESATAKISSLENLTTDQKTTQDSLWDQLTTASDTVTQTSRLTPSASYSLSTPFSGIISSLPYFFGYGSVPSLLRTGKGDPVQTQAKIALADQGDMIISLASSNEPGIAGYALTRKNKVYRILQNNDQTTLAPVSPGTGDFANGYTIGSYIGNIYLLDGKSGLLWKYLASGTGYNKGLSVLDVNKYDIKHSISLAIDGSIYLLKSDSTLAKFASGEQDASFSLKNIPSLSQKLVQPLQVITNENMQSIYVLDGGTTSNMRSNARILEFTKNGEFVRQYGFPKDYTRVSSFDIRPKDKMLWVVNNGQINEFNL
jgi:hypothetical protein